MVQRVVLTWSHRAALCIKTLLSQAKESKRPFFTLHSQTSYFWVKWQRLPFNPESWRQLVTNKKYWRTALGWRSVLELKLLLEKKKRQKPFKNNCHIFIPVRRINRNFLCSHWLNKPGEENEGKVSAAEDGLKKHNYCFTLHNLSRDRV